MALTGIIVVGRKFSNSRGVDSVAVAGDEMHYSWQ